MSSISSIGGGGPVAPMYTGSITPLHRLIFKVDETAIHTNLKPNLITQRNADGDTLTISTHNAMVAAGNTGPGGHSHHARSG